MTGLAAAKGLSSFFFLRERKTQAKRKLVAEVLRLKNSVFFYTDTNTLR